MVNSFDQPAISSCNKENILLNSFSAFCHIYKVHHFSFFFIFFKFLFLSFCPRRVYFVSFYCWKRRRRKNVALMMAIWHCAWLIERFQLINIHSIYTNDRFIITSLCCCCFSLCVWSMWLNVRFRLRFQQFNSFNNFWLSAFSCDFDPSEEKMCVKTERKQKRHRVKMPNYPEQIKTSPKWTRLHDDDDDDDNLI